MKNEMTTGIATIALAHRCYVGRCKAVHSRTEVVRVNGLIVVNATLIEFDWLSCRPITGRLPYPSFIVHDYRNRSYFLQDNPCAGVIYTSCVRRIPTTQQPYFVYFMSLLLNLYTFFFKQKTYSYFPIFWPDL